MPSSPRWKHSRQCQALRCCVAATRRSARRSADEWTVPVLRAGRGGPAERLAGVFGDLHPVVVFAVVMLVGLAAIAVLSIGLGLLVTRVVEPAWGIGAADERVNVWLAAHRTSSRTDASFLGSTLAGGLVLPIVVGSIALVCAVLRKWRIAAFVVFALAVESATYRATTLVIHSHRPRVVRLEHLPVNASYPSGHTAASIAVYGGLVLLLTSRFASGVFRAFAWTFVLAMVTFVAARAHVSRHAPPAGRRRWHHRRCRCRDRPRVRVPDGRCRGRVSRR